MIKNILRFLYKKYLIIRLLYKQRSSRKKHTSGDKKSVVVDIQSPGRFLPYLLKGLSFYADELIVSNRSHWYLFSLLNGYAAREAQTVYKTVSGRKTALAAADGTDMLELSNGERRKTVTLDYDYYEPTHGGGEKPALYFPYYMHPDVYKKGIDGQCNKLRGTEKSIRLLFAGSFDERVYRDNLRFDMMNRYDVCKTVIDAFGEKVTIVDTPQKLEELKSGETASDIVFIITKSLENNLQKHLLDQTGYLEMVSRSWFFLSPPGVKIPHSHNLIESMAVGTVPVFNYNRYFYPPLEDGKNCLAFETGDELITAVQTCLSMNEEQRAQIRREALAFYDTYLAPEVAFNTLESQLLETNQINQLKVVNSAVL